MYTTFDGRGLQAYWQPNCTLLRQGNQMIQHLCLLFEYYPTILPVSQVKYIPSKEQNKVQI